MQEEIQAMLAFYANLESKSKRSRKAAKKKRTSRAEPSKKRASVGPVGLIRQLREEGFFKGKRKISDIQKKLEERGYIYATTSLSPALVKLTRSRELRRIMEEDGYKYVAN